MLNSRFIISNIFIALEAFTITHGGKHLEKILSDFLKIFKY